MSRIGDLRANEENNLNLVKVLEIFSGGETKYVEMLLKLYKTMGDTLDIKVNTISARTNIDPEKIKVLTENEIDYLYFMCDNTIFVNCINHFNKFREYNEQNLIENKDLHSYKSFDQVINSVKIAHEKVLQKEWEKSIEKIHEDKEWLILVPLTYESSVKYGYNTKWCTASETTAEQYKSYTKDGVLIYIIQKGKTKTAAYKRIDRGEISFWDQKDNRIDSLQCNFPTYITEIVSEKLRKTNKPVHDPKDFVKSSQDLLNKYGIGISGVDGGMSSTTGYSGVTGMTSFDPEFKVYADPFAKPIKKKSFLEEVDGSFDDRMIDRSAYLQKALLETKSAMEDDHITASSLGFLASLNDLDDRSLRSRPTNAEPRPNFNNLMDSKDYLGRVKNLMRKLK
jgi:hypothetical protein